MKLKLMSSLAVLSLAAVGCGSAGPGSKAVDEMETASLGSQAQVTAFATFGPLQAYQFPQIYIAAATLAENGDAADCPRMTRDGDVVKFEGGCTNSEGIRYEGSLEIQPDAANPAVGKVTYNAFKATTPNECADGQTVDTVTTFDGTFTSKGTQTKSEFSMDLALTTDSLSGSGCSVDRYVVGLVYDGTIDGPAPSITGGEASLMQGASTWNVTGEIGISEFGAVTVETKDEVIDLAECDDGALSGTTTLTGLKKAEITFVGGQTCGASATWTLDGVAQGELTGVTCSAMGGGSLSAFGLLALGGLLLRRRRDAH